MTFPPLIFYCIWIISTHTLTWSVTTTYYRLAYDSGISTHTLTWSVTGDLNYKLVRTWFQLTRSRGAWPTGNEKTVHEFTFQLTRSRGAWQQRCGCHVATDDFNSHAHVERDKPHHFMTEKINISTHTLTWSVTYFWRKRMEYRKNFNSHAHVERDVLENVASIDFTFQLTRSRGAWRYPHVLILKCNPV